MEDRVTRDLSRASPTPITVVFDVGANIGQSTARFLTAWPEAHIYSFEPVKSTYAELDKKFGDSKSVSCEFFALGAKNDTETITANDSSTMNSIITGNHKGPVETIPVKTGDSYCNEKGLEKIHFLKIDTEGHDLAVLIGMVRMLSEHRIDFVQVEASMNPFNTRHIQIGEFLGFLQPLGYFLFGVYDQVREKRATATLRRSNLIFARNTLVS